MSEEIYDREIAPKLMEIAELCHRNSMSFLASVRFDEENYGTTASVSPDEHRLRLAFIYIRTGNIDAFVFEAAKLAKESGHSSIVLNNLLNQKVRS